MSIMWNDRAFQSFAPWIGKNYNETTPRLLLLGQSAYSWRDEQGNLIDPMSLEDWVNLPTTIVREVLSNDRNAFHDIGGDEGSNIHPARFIRILSRALAGEENPSQNTLYDVFHRVAFTNYVGGTTGECPGTSPTPAMWEAAKRAFRPDILNHPELRPERIIVIGKVMWDNMPDPDRVYRREDVRGYLLEDGSEAMCWMHSLRGLSWTELADTIRYSLGPPPWIG